MPASLPLWRVTFGLHLIRVVRPAELADAPMVSPAAVAMFTEEVGDDPTQHGPGYVSRVYELCRLGNTFIRTGIGPDGTERVEFKADIGASYNGVAQIQGVVCMIITGTGIATGAMAAVVELVRKRVAPTVSLYVELLQLRRTKGLRQGRIPPGWRVRNNPSYRKLTIAPSSDR